MESVIGRERELEAAAAFLEEPATGLSLLQINGDPGIGKTTVLDAVTAHAEELGHLVLRCAPAQAESSMPFVSLGDLLEPVLGDGSPPTLGPAQRHALEAALVHVEPPQAFGRLAVSRATLTLLRELVSLGPVLVAIDDVQWLDASSATVCQFAFRRLTAGEIRAVTAVRSGTPAPALDPPPGHEAVRISVGPLSVDEVGRLIAPRLRSPLTRPRLAELHQVTRGNPYFALEIVRAVGAHTQPLEAASSLPIPDDIAALLGRRIAELSPEARDVLLLCACTAQPTVGLVSRLSGSDGLQEVAAAGIVERHGERLRFCHPLLASYVYGSTEHAALQDAHVRLAAVVDNPHERALHLARATDLPDEAIACELEEAALGAHRRGAPAAAAELENHARRLTPRQLEQERLRRAARTAEYHCAAGDTQRGRELLEELLDAPMPQPERARVMLRLGGLRYVSDDVGAAHALFEGALAGAGDDAGLRAEAEQSLAFTSMLGGNVPRALTHARSALELAQTIGDPGILALASCRVALNEFLMGQGLDRHALERAIELEGHLDGMPFEQLPSYTLATLAAMADDFVTAAPLFERVERSAAEYGDERAVLTGMFSKSEFLCRAGDWGQATRLATRAVERSRQGGFGTIQVWSLHALALVQAHVGQVAAARETLAEGVRLAQLSGSVAPMTQLASTLGFLELSLDDPAAAHAQLGPLSDFVAAVGIGEPGVVRFMPNEIEVLIRLGQLEEAQRLLALLEERAMSLDRISMRAAAARARALLAAAQADFEGARASIAEARAQHARLDEPFEFGRTLLAEGSIERRARRRGPARTALNRALEIFDQLGAGLWSERAASELARIPGRRPASADLSETERRVAALAAEGLANKEIASRLYVTVRTVEAHLSKIYAKLGVRSRVELVSRVGSGEQA